MLSIRDLARPGLRLSALDVEDGECVGVRGPSGAGKTLLLRAIADLDPNEGSVALDSLRREAMPAPRWRRLVSFVAAEPGWWADTVGEHYPDWAAAEPRVEELGLPAACRSWPVLRLSTGERQRLGLVRALVLDPRALLLDEPTSGLDETAAAAVERIVTRRLRAGTSVLWVSHDDALMRRIARRVIEVANGETRVREAVA